MVSGNILASAQDGVGYMFLATTRSIRVTDILHDFVIARKAYGYSKLYLTPEKERSESPKGRSDVSLRYLA